MRISFEALLISTNPTLCTHARRSDIVQIYPIMLVHEREAAQRVRPTHTIQVNCLEISVQKRESCQLWSGFVDF